MMSMALGLMAQSRIPDFHVDSALMVRDDSRVSVLSIPDYPGNWSNVARLPHVGRPVIPVILIEYADYEFTFRERSEWIKWLNSSDKQTIDPMKSHSSVGEYFEYCSDGNFRPIFEVFGPYKLEESRAKYGYGKEVELVKAAIGVADNDIDFSQYCVAKPGVCDLVYVIAAGTGHNRTNSNADIHPCCGVSSFGKLDGVYLYNYGVSNELAAANRQEGIGVFCHEISHGLGLPDLYPNVRKKDYNNDEPEEWDLMDNGENALQGFWPQPYLAWERDAFGWIEPDTLRESRQVTLYPLCDERGVACKFVNPYNDREWWMIENIPCNEPWYRWVNQMVGRNGLLIMHLDNNKSSNEHGYLTLAAPECPNNPCSATGGKPRCTVLAADSLLVSLYNADYNIMTTLPDGSKVKTDKTLYEKQLKGDLYPGSSNVTQLWKFKNYYGNKDTDNKVVDLTDEGYAIRNITLNDDGSVTFDFYYGDAPTALHEVTPGGDSHLALDDVYRITPNLIIVNGHLKWLVQ